MQNKYSHISSIKDPRVIFARSLNVASNRQKQQACLLYGKQALDWALQSKWNIENVFCSKNSLPVIQNSPLIREICIVSEGIMKKISDTSYLIPVLAVALMPSPGNHINKMDDILLLLDGIKDHGNLGTILRTACAFGINRTILLNMQSDLFNRKTVDASRGTVFNIHASHHHDSVCAIQKLKSSGYQIIVTTPYGSKLQSELRIKKQPVALVIGSESEGVSSEVTQLADACIQIPMQPEVESLNVGVAAGISLYEIRMKVVLAMLKKKIQSTLGREINVAGKLIMCQLEQELTTVSHFTAREAIFLMQLSCDREMNPVQISQDTGMFGNDLKIFLKRLHKNNFIHPISGTEGTWQITDAGDKWLAKIWPVIERAEKKALQGFSDDEIFQLMDFLQRIQESCN